MNDDAVIRVERVTREYLTGKTMVRALRGVDLRVERGEMLAIMGPSGSGKSTLMNIVGCLDRATSGSYWLDGERVDDLTRNALADIRNRKIGFVFQGFNLLPRTSALENVALPLLYDRTGRRLDVRALAQDALARVGLSDRLEHDPTELSGGEQQRVAIARALVTNPAIVLADEPTGNLDSNTSIEVMALFQALHNDGITILLVTHEAEIAAYTQRIIHMRDGCIVSDQRVGNPRRAGADLLSAARDSQVAVS